MVRLSSRRVMPRIVTLLFLFSIGPLYLLSGCGSNDPPAPIQTTAHLHSIHFVDRKNGWTAGSDGTIFKTTNGGQSWQDLTTDTEFPLTDTINRIFFTNRDHGWLVSLKGQIYYTVNGGQIWRQQSSGLGNGLTDLFFVKKLRFFAINKHSLSTTPDRCSLLNLR